MPTLPGAVGDNSMQAANIVSTTSMSQRFDTMIKEPTMQRRHPCNGLKDSSGVLGVDMEKRISEDHPKSKPHQDDSA